MPLDMMTMSAVAVTVTAVLGLVLVFDWARQGGSAFVGLWGFALLLMSAGIVVAAVSSRAGLSGLLVLGQALMILPSCIQWYACRQFSHRRPSVIYMLVGPVGFLLAAGSGYAETFDDRLILLCGLIAAYSFSAAVELAYANGEQLPSRWPAVVLLVLTGVSFLSWLPLIAAMPIHEAGAVFSSSWFPVVILVTVLLRVALAFIVLSMAKERQEEEQRVNALTDSLTGLPNRRALFEAADAFGHRRILGGTPVAVLIFDLDHFKETNDSYGHELGDAVLKVFALTVAKHLSPRGIVGRLGGEEFAAILPGADAPSAAESAEVVRRAFARSAAFINGLAVGATVSVGVASDVEVDTDLSGLFRRADAALYIAKRAGRNQVALLESDDQSFVAAPTAAIRTSPSRLKPTPPILPRRPVRIA
ncbi:MAG: GGDEF domain-containing protein [Methyloceanibacter sp.]|uniref:GGDEF domain-containing protein n=1 Tax=Methyloceanibacter sp. TaxID=1965321 RepID=UPI003D6D9D4A